MSKRDLDLLRKLCLALPETTEVLTWEDHPTFRVRDKIFCIAAADGRGVSLKATKEEQPALIASNPAITKAPYVGQHGWISVDIPALPDKDELDELIRESYRLIAPKKLAALVD